MNEHLERLEAALADRYTIERKLGRSPLRDHPRFQALLEKYE